MTVVRVLGLESSCDDTCAAVIDSNHNILSNIVITQKQEHEIYKGVVPEIASRSHMNNLEYAIKSALEEANMSISGIDVIAATSGPGLIGGVIVGSMMGKALSSVLGKPFIAVNHLEGHALIPKLTDDVQYPYLLLLASGGHCQFVAVECLGKYKILGRTLDDAIGEAFDKVAKMMNLGFPGGPEIEKRAKDGDAKRFGFPKPMINSGNCDMSFSGLKTAVRLQIEKLGKLTKQDIADVAASFQQVVTEIIVKKTKQAIAQYEELYLGKTIVVSGGVAANLAIRKSMQETATACGYNFVAPPIKLCTDNAVMIAFAGLSRFKDGKINHVDFKPRARWSLEELDY